MDVATSCPPCQDVVSDVILTVAPPQVLDSLCHFERRPTVVLLFAMIADGVVVVLLVEVFPWELSADLLPYCMDISSPLSKHVLSHLLFFGSLHGAGSALGCTGDYAQDFLHLLCLLHSHHKCGWFQRLMCLLSCSGEGARQNAKASLSCAVLRG